MGTRTTRSTAWLDQRNRSGHRGRLEGDYAGTMDGISVPREMCGLDAICRNILYSQPVL